MPALSPLTQFLLLCWSASLAVAMHVATILCAFPLMLLFLAAVLVLQLWIWLLRL